MGRVFLEPCCVHGAAVGGMADVGALLTSFLLLRGGVLAASLRRDADRNSRTAGIAGRDFPQRADKVFELYLLLDCANTARPLPHLASSPSSPGFLVAPAIQGAATRKASITAIGARAAIIAAVKEYGGSNESFRQIELKEILADLGGGCCAIA